MSERVTGNGEVSVEGPKSWLSVNTSLYAVVACAILPALSIILYNGFTLREQVLSEARNRLDNLTESIATLQSEKTHLARTLGHTLAALPQVRHFDALDCSNLFAHLLHENKALANIVLLDATGKVQASALPASNDLDLSDRTSFRDAVRTKSFSAGDFMVSRIAKVPVMQFSTPVLDENSRLLGVVLVTYDLGKYHPFFAQLTLPADSRLTLMDRGGVRLLALAKGSDPPPIGQPIVAENWRTIVESKEESGSFIATRYDGTTVLFYFSKLRLLESEPPYMVVLLNIPLSVIYRQADKTLMANLALMAGAALLAMIIARLLGRKLVGRQVEAIKESEERFRQLFDNMQEGLAIYRPVDQGQDFVFVSLNRAGQALGNVTLNDVAGRRVTDVFPSVRQFGLLEAMRRVHSTGEPEHLPLNIYSDNRLTHSAENYVFRLPSGLVVTLFSDTSVQRMAEEALRESERKFRTLFESMTEGAAVHEMVYEAPGKAVDYRILDVNRSFERQTGIDRSKAVGALASLVYGSDAPPYLDIYARVAEGAEPEWFETYFPPLNKHFRISAFSPDKGRFVTIFQDITEAKLLEEKLKKSESKLRATLNSLPAMISYWDANLRNGFANQTYLQWFGINADTIDGMHLRDVIGEESFTSNQPYIQGVLAGTAQAFERAAKNPDGHSIRHSFVQYIPDVADGAVLGFYSLITNITQVKTAEIALMASLREKEVLLKEIHHRVKNNLQIISSLLSLQEKGIENPEAQRILLDCQGRVMSMALVHDQLHRSDNLGGIDMAPYLGELLRRLAIGYKGKRDITMELAIASIALSLDQAIPFGLIANELATNAFKHAFNGVQKGTITISAVRNGQNVAFTIADNGKGLPGDFSLDGQSTLGLQIVTLLANQLHGTLAVESDGGTRFRLEFPIDRD
ncbi:MAG: PAS domain-containing protein [Desulfovibrio sp.]|nr:PAS domain-containing protein [Desulfovibrio sp.]MBI4961245.1 PAS domain-containing protein [Desulfovibrio sp.]